MSKQADRESNMGQLKSRQDKVSLDGETVEPRILLSASWLVDALLAPASLQDATVDAEEIMNNHGADETLPGDTGDQSEPTAKAGADQSVNEGEFVILDGKESTAAEGSSITYHWQQTSGPAVEIINQTSSVATFVAPNGLTNSTAQFELTVSDGATSSTDTVNILIGADNDAPTASAGANRKVEAGEIVVLGGDGSYDPEGQELTYTWIQIGGPPVELQQLDPSTDTDNIANQQVSSAETNASAELEQGSYTAMVSSNGANVGFVADDSLIDEHLTFQLVVSDGENTSIDTVELLVGQAGGNRNFVIDLGEDFSAAANETITLDGTPSAANGWSITHRHWAQIGNGPTVDLTVSTTGQLTFQTPTGYTGETLLFEFTATATSSQTSNTNGEATSVTASDRIEITLINSAPEVTNNHTYTFQAGRLAEIGVQATDIDNDQLTYSWSQVSGPLASVYGTGNRAYFTAPQVSSPTHLVFRVEVSDGTASATELVHVLVQPGSNQQSNSQSQGGSGGGGGSGGEGGSSSQVSSGGEAGSSSQVSSAVEAGSTGLATGNPNATPTGTTTSESEPEHTAESHQTILAETRLTPTGEDESEVSGTPSQTLSSLFSAGAERASELYEDEQVTEISGDSKIAASDDVAAENFLVDEQAAILVAAESTVDIAPMLDAPKGNKVEFLWTQISGTNVNILTADLERLRIETPATFVEETLVFEVEILVDGLTTTRDVRVQVQPVDAEQRDASAGKKYGLQRLMDTDNATFEEKRGIGKIWASMVVLTSIGGPSNTKQ